MRFYKGHYDVVIIGGALAGMAAALQLQAKGVRDILILEKHNMPGGVATDYMRDGFEMEASLHEMMSIGPKGKRLKVGRFFDDMGIDIDWLPVPEPYRVVVPGEGIDTVLHDGYEHMARDIDAACPGTYDKVLEFIRLCRRVYDSMDVISVTPMSKLRMLREHPDFVRVAAVLSLLVLVFWRTGSFAALGAAPKYCWFGGVLALAITVTVMLGMGRLGPTLAVATILIAQLVTAAAIDAFGIMGTEKLAFGWSKWAGLALMTGGVLLFKMK